jgi:hypothetical protein
MRKNWNKDNLKIGMPWNLIKFKARNQKIPGKKKNYVNTFPFWCSVKYEENPFSASKIGLRKDDIQIRLP